MSRGFVKEDDQEEAPFISPRAALPAGVKNYVTPAGHRELLRERKGLEEELRSLNIPEEKEKRHKTAVLTGKLLLLNERLSSARVINPSDQPGHEVRFGARVSFEYLSGSLSGRTDTFQLVGVDQADVGKNRIAFISPIARALTGKKIGEIAEFKLGEETRSLKVLGISYKPDL